MKEGPLGNSFRDPSGFVYRRNGAIYRQINNCYRPTWKKFIDCGLYDELVASGSLISHQVAAEENALTDEGWLIIKPKAVNFWSYPYEWCFSQLKDAALLTLQIQKKALKYGMSLKDASAYNVQFVDCKPILIDSLSFENFNPERGWDGFRQFCMHFLAPLALMSKTDYRLGQLFRIYMDGVPLDLASSLLPWKSWLNFPTLMYIHLHARSEKRNSGFKDAAKSNRVMPKHKVEAIVESLVFAIKKLNIRPSSTWVDYYSDIHYGQEAFMNKERLVGEYIESVSPDTVWDLGANTGSFSLIASRHANFVASFDFDMAAVESNYKTCKGGGHTNVLPLCLDLANPSPKIGWANEETSNLRDRAPVDLILALALVHHLAIAYNILLDRIAQWLAVLTKNLIIEFVPKSDPMVQKLLSHRQDIFIHYDEASFEYVFSQYFRIIKSQEISGTNRSIYLMESLPTRA